MMTMSQNSGVPLPTQMTPQSLAQFVPQAMAANRQRKFYGDMMAADPTFATQYFTGLENQARTKLAERQLGFQETEFNTQQRRQAEEDARIAKREQAMQDLAERMRASNGGITDYLSDFASVFPEKGLPMLANYKLEQEAMRVDMAREQAQAAREQADIAMRRDMLANLAGMRTPGINPEADPQIRDLRTLDDVMAAMEGGQIQTPMQAVQQPAALPDAPASPMTPKALAALQIAQMNPTDTNLMKVAEAMSEVPEQNFDKAKMEGDLRKEFDALTKPFREVRDAHRRIQTAGTNASPAGDLALIFNYMKMLDPGSTVREGEFATAQNSGSIPTRIQALYNRVQTGERLAPEQRTDFLAQANNLFSAAEETYITDASRYQEIAKQYGLDPARVAAPVKKTKNTDLRKKYGLD